MLRGNYAARIDDKGRLKIPNAFRALIERTHGRELFVTSLTGDPSASTRCRLAEHRREARRDALHASRAPQVFSTA